MLWKRIHYDVCTKSGLQIHFNGSYYCKLQFGFRREFDGIMWKMMVKYWLFPRFRMQRMNSDFNAMTISFLKMLCNHVSSEVSFLIEAACPLKETLIFNPLKSSKFEYQICIVIKHFNRYPLYFPLYYWVLLKIQLLVNSFRTLS